MKETILLVEDDIGLMTVTKQVLADGGYLVAPFASVEEALVSIQKHLPDLIVSDVGLPGLSGLRLCEILKKDPRTVPVPIILLTQFSSESDKVRGLKTGADDYLTKPFSHRELLARIEALLRRTQRAGALPQQLQVKDLVVDIEKREVTIGGKAIDLRRKEYELLILLMQNSGRILSKNLIVDTLWKDEAIVTKNTLNVHIRNLRGKLGRYRNMIKTFIGEGYRFSED